MSLYTVDCPPQLPHMRQERLPTLGALIRTAANQGQCGYRSILCLISGSTWKDGPTPDRIWSASCADSITTRSGSEAPLTRTPVSRATASAAVRPWPRHSLRVATTYVVMARSMPRMSDSAVLRKRYATALIFGNQADRPAVPNEQCPGRLRSGGISRQALVAAISGEDNCEGPAGGGTGH